MRSLILCEFCGESLPYPLEIGEFVSIWNRHRESWAMLADRWD